MIWLLEHCDMVITDGGACKKRHTFLVSFQALQIAGCCHQRKVVGKDRKSTSMDCFRWVNTILGNLKNAITGTYHAFDFEKYAHRYLGEVQYRFNRRFDLPGMFKSFVVATARSGMVPAHNLRLAED